MNTFDGCCGSCVHMNTNEYSGHKDHCYCTYRRQYYNLTERKCYHYEYDRYKDYYDLNRRWYVMSTILERLGLNPDFESVQLLQNFRINVLDKDPRYNSFLAEYDILGPKIAELLAKDNDSVKLCQRLSQAFLTRVLAEIMDGNHDKALNLYIEMIEWLKQIYDVDLIKSQEETKIK